MKKKIVYKERIVTVIKIAALILICFLMTTLMNYCHERVKTAGAMETTTFTYYVNQSVDTIWKGMRAYSAAYYDACHKDTSQDSSFNFYAGVGYDGTDKWSIRCTQVGFTLTGLPGDAEVVAMRIKAQCHAKTIHPVWGDNNWLSWWATKELNGSVTNADFDNAIDDYQPKNRLSGPVLSSSYDVGSNVTWIIHPSDYQYMLTPTVQNKVWVMLASENQMLDWQPLETAVGIMSSTFRAGYNDGTDVRLEIDYVSSSEPYTQTFHENAAIDTTILGDEVADNITWRSPRLLYSDQFPEIFVHGDSGAPVKLDLLDVNGKVLDSIADSVRVDGKYAWKMENVPSSYRGYIRIRENNYNLMSQWANIEASPGAGQPTGRVLAYSTNYPQYETAFESYIVNRGSKMVVHWRTSISWANASDYSLRIWVRGDSDNATGEVYIAALDEFAEIYLGIVSEQSTNFHWRYALFTPALLSGQSDYSGLVNNLNIPFDSTHKGFLQAVIYHDSESVENTNTHSAHWYLTNAAEGIKVSSKYSNYGKENDIFIDCEIGRECNVEYDLSAVEISLYEAATDELVRKYSQSAIEGKNNWQIAGLKDEDSYYALVKFYSDEKSYAYITRINFTVSGTVSSGTPPTGSIDEWLKNILKKYGMDNDTGHWLILIAGMLILFILTYKSPLLRVALPLALFGFGIYLQWVDIWIVALLAIGAGFTIYRGFRKQAQGGAD